MAWQVTITDRSGTKRTKKLDQLPTIIGRDPSASIPVNDSELSRQHCQLEASGSGIAIVDLKSSNGTNVNGRRIERSELTPGDRITCGGLTIQVERIEGKVTVQDDTAHHKLSILKSFTPDRAQSTLSVNRAGILGRLAGSKDEAGVAGGKRIEALAQLGVLLADVDTLEPFMELFLSTVIETLPFECAAILLKTPGTDHLSPASSKFTASASGFLVSRTIYQHVFTTNQAIVTENALADERFIAGESVVTSRVRAVICSPLQAHGRTVGVLYASSRESAAQFDEKDLSYLTVLGSLLATAVRITRPELM